MIHGPFDDRSTIVADSTIETIALPDWWTEVICLAARADQWPIVGRLLDLSRPTIVARDLTPAEEDLTPAKEAEIRDKFRGMCHGFKP